MKYPKGTKFNRWTLNRQNQRGVERFAIWRWVRLPDNQTKLERLPVAKYRHIRDNETELKALILRLNDEVSRNARARETVLLKHAYIDSALLDEFKTYLLVQIPSKGKATTTYYYATKYFINFFIGKLGLKDPLMWHQVHETKWAEFLLGKEAPPSADTKKNIVAAANRFISWLHKKRPSEVPPLVFKPLTLAKYKEVEAKRRLAGIVKIRKPISDSDWRVILEKAPTEIKPFIQLSYCYGLRRSESMGLKLSDVRRGFLSIERQLLAFTNSRPKYGPLKGRQERTCPHWFANPELTYKWIAEGLNRLMHPDTLTDTWNELMGKLKMDYDVHDIRHTWVTRAIKEHSPRDVQLAAGHKNIQTTMRYAHDHREMDAEVFTPVQSIRKSS